jgi:hypothetical protein
MPHGEAMPDLKFDLEDDLSISAVVSFLASSSLRRREFKEQTERYERFLRLIENKHDAQIIAEREGQGPLLRGPELSDGLRRELKKDGLL